VNAQWAYARLNLFQSQALDMGFDQSSITAENIQPWSGS